MKRAKEKVQELLNSRLPDRESDDYVEHLDELKPRINNLLLMYLPDTTTVKEADTIGMVIFEMLVNPNEFLLGSD